MIWQAVLPGNQDIRLIQLGGASGKVCGPDKLDTPYTYWKI